MPDRNKQKLAQQKAKKAEAARIPITQAGHPVLRARAGDVDAAFLTSTEGRALVAKMVRAMREAPGVGLAAPQLGVPLRLLVVEDTEERMSRLEPEERKTRERSPFPLTIVANPSIEIVGDRRATFFEGCLSVNGYVALVERASEVVVRGMDGEGAPLELHLTGWPARIFQHECDHLEGTLYVDRMLTRTFATNAEAMERWLEMSIEDVKKALQA